MNPSSGTPLSGLPAPLRRGVLRVLGRLAGRAGQVVAADRFADVQAATRVHQGEHGCTAFTYGDGLLPAVLAAALTHDDPQHAALHQIDDTAVRLIARIHRPPPARVAQELLDAARDRDRSRWSWLT